MGKITRNELAPVLVEELESKANKSDIPALNNTVTSESTTEAATANAVKQAYDRAEQAFQSASNGKTVIANAVTGKGVPTNASDTFQQMATNITNIKVGEYGTASASDVRNTKTIGTENGIVQGTLDLTNLKPENIKSGIIIDGVTGSLQQYKTASGSVNVPKGGSVDVDIGFTIQTLKAWTFTLDSYISLYFDGHKMGPTSSWGAVIKSVTGNTATLSHTYTSETTVYWKAVGY